MAHKWLLDIKKKTKAEASLIYEIKGIFKIFNGKVMALQCCVSFCHT